MAQAKYNQIFQTLRGRIDSGAYGFLELLPSENTLAEEFTCTRNTVRKALALLVAQGYVQTMQGRGVQVICRPAAAVSLAQEIWCIRWRSADSRMLRTVACSFRP